MAQCCDVGWGDPNHFVVYSSFWRETVRNQFWSYFWETPFSEHQFLSSASAFLRPLRPASSVRLKDFLQFQAEVAPGFRHGSFSYDPGSFGDFGMQLGSNSHCHVPKLAQKSPYSATCVSLKIWILGAIFIETFPKLLHGFVWPEMTWIILDLILECLLQSIIWIYHGKKGLFQKSTEAYRVLC